MLSSGSLFAGIGGFDLGFERAGMRCLWQCEIDPYCQRVLEKHWPDVLRVRDIRDLHARDAPAVDVLCGGFPCQDLSFAGKGAGIDGARSGLWATWPRSGTMRSGTASRLRPLAPLTAATDSGLLPTPLSRDWKDSGSTQGTRKSPNLGTVAHWPTPHGMPKPGQARNPGPSGNELGRAVNRAEREMWPTPRALPNENRQTKPTPSQLAGTHGMNLATAVAEAERKQLPTPTASRRTGLQSHGVNVVTGALNPTFVEFLMGFPKDWTEVE